MNQTTETRIAGESISSERMRIDWAFPGMLTLLAIIATIAIYRETAWSMVAIWLDSDTFAHGFVILPISAFLVWRKRHELAMLQPMPVSYGPVVLIIPGLIWLLGYISDVQVVQQFCFVATIILLVLGPAWLGGGEAACLSPGLPPVCRAVRQVSGALHDRFFRCICHWCPAFDRNSGVCRRDLVQHSRCRLGRSGSMQRDALPDRGACCRYAYMPI